MQIPLARGPTLLLSTSLTLNIGLPSQFLNLLRMSVCKVISDFKRSYVCFFRRMASFFCNAIDKFKICIYVRNCNVILKLSFAFNFVNLISQGFKIIDTFFIYSFFGPNTIFDTCQLFTYCKNTYLWTILERAHKLTCTLILTQARKKSLIWCSQL